MASFTVTIVSGSGTTTGPANFSSSDAQRILSGFRKFTNSSAASQQDLTNYVRKQALQEFNRWINMNEVIVTTPTPPEYTSS